jgi:hypothetical protein
VRLLGVEVHALRLVTYAAIMILFVLPKKTAVLVVFRRIRVRTKEDATMTYGNFQAPLGRWRIRKLLTHALYLL